MLRSQEQLFKESRKAEFVPSQAIFVNVTRSCYC